MCDLERSQAMTRFNPDALTLKHGRLILEAEDSFKIFLDRPQGDMFAHLCAEINRLAKLEAPLTEAQKQSFIEANGTIVCVAMWDHAMPPEARVVVRKIYANLVPRAEMYWRTLVLYRAVVRYSEETGVELPANMQDERVAWGQSILRCAGAVSHHKSKTSYRSLLARYAKDLKKRVNPYNDSEPEDKVFIDYAFKFSYWDASLRDSESKRPNSERRRRGALRRDILDALQGLRSSMTSLASFYKENTRVVAMTTAKDGRYGLVTGKNRFVPIDELTVRHKTVLF